MEFRDKVDQAIAAYDVAYDDAAVKVISHGLTRACQALPAIDYKKRYADLRAELEAAAQAAYDVVERNPIDGAEHEVLVALEKFKVAEAAVNTFFQAACAAGVQL